MSLRTEKAVRDRTHVLRADLDTVLLLQEGTDVAGRHAACVHGNDPVVGAVELTSVLGQQYGLEGALTIARCVDFDDARVRTDALARKAVVLVPELARPDEFGRLGFGSVEGAFGKRRNAVQLRQHLALKGRLDEALHDYLSEALVSFRPFKEACTNRLVDC